MSRLPEILRLSAESVGRRAATILKDRGITLATDEQINEAMLEAAQQFGAEREALQVQKGLTCEQAVLELCGEVTVPVAPIAFHPIEQDLDKPYPAKSEVDATYWAAFQHPHFVDALKAAGQPCEIANVESIRMALVDAAKHLWRWEMPITVHALGLRLNKWVKTQRQLQQVSR